MFDFAESIVMAVPPETAFAFLADPSTAHVIDPAVISYVPERLPMDVGVHNEIRFRMFGLPMRARSVVLEWEPGRRMVMENVRPSKPLRAIATHLFEPHPDGCRYTWAMRFEPTVPGGGLAVALLSRFMRANARRQQVRFKAAVEARA